MEIVLKKASALGCFVIFGWWVACPAQEPQGSPEPTPSPATPSPSSSPTTKAPSPTSTDGGALDYLYNKSPSDGSAGKEANDLAQRIKDKAAAGDALGFDKFPDEQTRARFIKYLGTPEVTRERLAAYATTYDQVRKLLRDNRLVEAWRGLHLLAEYEEIDAQVSRELANRIETIWGVNRSSVSIARQNEKLKSEATGAARSADMMSQSIRDQDVQYHRKLNQGNQNRSSGGNPNGGVPSANAGGDVPSAPTVQSLMGKMQLTEEYLRGLELKAKIKLNEMKAEKVFEQAKTDFSEYISTLYQSGRYRHVLLASEFFLRLFEQTDYPVAVGQQVNASLEAAREVQSAVDVFNYKLDRRELVAASDRLQEAFLLCEYHPALLSVERIRKDQVEGLHIKFERLKNMIEARDFGALETALSELKGSAIDFDATKPNAIINGIKLESRLRLGKAKLAAQQGKLEEAMAEFQRAAETWPGNPEIETNAQLFFQTQDVANQTLVEFDRLFAEGNIRGIFEKQLAIAPALKDDTKRQGQLKEALEQVKLAEMALEKAATLRNNGDVFGAWETVELAVVNLPNDIKLNMLRGELAGRGAEFVAALNKAKEAEARSEWGFSLSWFAVAQRFYPASQIANQAIEKISKQILEESL